MAKQLVSPAQKLLIEKLGVMHEQAGLQPAAARVLSLLIVSNNPELTFEEIIEALQISKSAASNAINLLLKMNRIEYITKPGDRKRYFRAEIYQWRESSKNHFDGMIRFSEILKQVLEQRPGSTVEFNNSLHELISFLEFLHEKLPLLYAEWERKRKVA